MSVTFSIRGIDPDWDNNLNFINCSNHNAAEILKLLGLYTNSASELIGAIRCRDVAQRIEKVLAVPLRDDAIEGYESTGATGCRVVSGGRRAGYLADRLRALKALVAQGKDLGVLEWS